MACVITFVSTETPSCLRCESVSCLDRKDGPTACLFFLLGRKTALRSRLRVPCGIVVTCDIIIYMEIEAHPEHQLHPEQSADWEASFAAALNNVVETLFTREAITERIRGYEDDELLQIFLQLHKQSLAKELEETAEPAIERFLHFIDGLRLKPGIPLFPPMSEAEYQQRVEVIVAHKPFTVASVCRADLQGIFSDEQIARISDGEMESIADRMGNAFTDSGLYWESLEIMAKYVIEKEELE